MPARATGQRERFVVLVAVVAVVVTVIRHLLEATPHEVARVVKYVTDAIDGDGGADAEETRYQHTQPNVGLAVLEGGWRCLDEEGSHHVTVGCHVQRLIVEQKVGPAFCDLHGIGSLGVFAIADLDARGIHDVATRKHRERHAEPAQ